MTESISLPIPSGFDQLVEIHPLTDTYKILYIKKGRTSPLEESGSFSHAIQYMSEHCVHPDDVQNYMLAWDTGTVLDRLRRFENIQGISLDYRLQKHDGTYVWITDYIILADDDQEDPIIMNYSKNTELFQRHKLHEQSYGLPVKINMYRETEFFLIADAWIQDTLAKSIAFFVVDIDYFKMYNDIYGRVAGNSLLSAISERLLKLAKEYDGIAGYLGGDNFCLLLPYGDENDTEFRQTLHEKLASLRSEGAFSTSFGICVDTPGRHTSMELYDRALIALSRIKNDYNKQTAYYKEGDLKRLRAEQILMIDAEKALKDREFIFYLQPKVDIHTRRITGSEALVRWKKGDDIISPGAFIGVLEKNGYIFALDRYIWEAVAEYQRKLMDQGIEPLPISVNVSRIDFHFADIAEYFIGMVERHGIEAKHIQVEVTESAYAQDTTEILKCCKKLHAAGFTILLDDFGSGYSSLNSLKSLYIDVLKIDKRFLDFESKSDSEHSIISTIINMAHMLRMLVVTEGVETEDQAKMLADMNCNYAQGYYFYRPMPVEEFTKLIRDPSNTDYSDPQLKRTHVGKLRIDELISQKLISNELLCKLLGPCLVYEVFDNNVQILQQNIQYSKLTGYSEKDEFNRLNVINTFIINKEAFFSMLEDAKNNKNTGCQNEGIYRFKDGTEHVLKSLTFCISETDTHSFYLMQIKEIDAL